MYKTNNWHYRGRASATRYYPIHNLTTNFIDNNLGILHNFGRDDNADVAGSIIIDIKLFN